MPAQIIYHRANAALAGLAASTSLLAPAADSLIHCSLERVSGQVLDELLLARLFGDFQRLMQGH